VVIAAELEKGSLTEKQIGGRRVFGRKRAQSGVAVLEMALFAPWFFFLFVGALDWAFLASALISLQSAASTAALYTSTSSSTAADSSQACNLVLGEMRKVPNIGTAVTTCSGNPVSVTATSVIGPDSATSSQVTVTYGTISLIPIPGLIPGQFTLTRSVIMRLRG
jgi:Flp pilus assembly protein TadG